MSQGQPIIINGQQIGRLKASWILFKEAWGFLRSDKEMIWIPVITTLLNLFLFGILVTAFILSVGITSVESTQTINKYLDWGFIFGAYVIGAFTLALAQAAIANTVYTRIKGGDATLGQSLSAAFSHWFPLFIWSLITSTVGLILRVIAERSNLLGKIIAALLGAAWGILTFFVVPAMVIDKKSPFASVKKSSQVFRATWGETLATNISLSLTFILAHVLVLMSVIGLMFVVSVLALPSLNYIVLAVAYLIWFVLAILVASVLDSVLRTLLYVYAAEGIRPANFNADLLDNMLKKTIPTQPAVLTPVPDPAQNITQ
jgi:Family of unknown function (DUF6159)